MAFFKNRLSFDVSYLTGIPKLSRFSLWLIALTSGYTAQNMNLGKIRNRGIELLISGT
ncbi:hypothetical protein [Bacteroides thetaiotaomicron]|uniref:hypothetical protein n=1 Tax=Bacteroides thetaiotaomicron TaxID=818 RepID=UPI002869877A|nr:hypothetical protein [Bacteroides thetaiotaomicron]